MLLWARLCSERCGTWPRVCWGKANKSSQSTYLEHPSLLQCEVISNIHDAKFPTFICVWEIKMVDVLLDCQWGVGLQWSSFKYYLPLAVCVSYWGTLDITWLHLDEHGRTLCHTVGATCFKVNSRQCKSLSENFTMSAVCPEPALFPNHGISDFLSWKVQQNQERYWIWCYIFIRCGVLELFLLNIGRGIWRVETGLLFSPFEKRGWIHHENWHFQKNDVVCVMGLKRHLDLRGA